MFQTKCHRSRRIAWHFVPHFVPFRSGPPDRTAAAVRAVTQVRQTFLEEGNAFDAALAALDLSISHLQGKTAEVRKLAGEMVTVFCNLEVAREPMAAFLLSQEAARRETATAELAREVAASLTQVRRGAAPG